MKKTVVVVLLLTNLLLAGEDPAVAAPRTKEHPWMSVKTWNDKHENLVKRAKEGKIDVLFLGDSITEGWNNNAAWQKHYTPLNAANFGIGGDTTQNVLWRITTGKAIDGLSPKVVVVMIGTNNFGINNDKPEDVARGIGMLVKTLRQKLPASKVLLLGIFPRDEKPDTRYRKLIKEVNAMVAKLDDKKTVRYLDIADKMLSPDGTLTADVAPGFLHLSPKGYEVWAEAMNPLLTEMLK